MKFWYTSEGNGSTVIVFYHFWKGERIGPLAFKRFYPELKRDYTCIYYSYTSDIISADVNGTRDNFLNILESTEKNLSHFPQAYVVGASLGSVLGLLLASRCNKVKKLALNTAGWSLPYLVWYGGSMRGIKQELERKGWTLEKLTEAWAPISPENNPVRAKDILLMLSNNDEAFVPSNVERLVEELTKENRVRVIWNSHKHRRAVFQNFLLKEELYGFLNGTPKSNV